MKMIKKKILSEINKRIKSKKAMIGLIKECCQEENQKENMIIFRMQINELKSLYEYINKL